MRYFSIYGLMYTIFCIKFQLRETNLSIIILSQNNKEDAADHECAEDDDSHHSNHGVPPNAAPEYKRLIAIQGGKTKGKVEQWINADPDKVRRVSLSEEKLESIVLTHGKEIIR